jgi:hypothetical protein
MYRNNLEMYRLLINLLIYFSFFELIGTIPVPTDTTAALSPAPIPTLSCDRPTLAFGNEHPLS